MPVVLKTYRMYVYGTLRKDAINHDSYLRESTFLKEATLPGYSLHFDNKLPFVVKASKEQNVVCEAYLVTENVLRRLDYLEGHPSFYKRHVVKDSEGIAGYLYVMPKEYATQENKIDHGDFIKFIDDIMEREARMNTYNRLSAEEMRILQNMDIVDAEQRHSLRIENIEPDLTEDIEDIDDIDDEDDDEYVYLDHEEYDAQYIPTLFWDKQTGEFWCIETWYGKMRVVILDNDRTTSYCISGEREKMSKLNRMLSELKDSRPESADEANEATT